MYNFCKYTLKAYICDEHPLPLHGLHKVFWCMIVADRTSLYSNSSGVLKAMCVCASSEHCRKFICSRLAQTYAFFVRPPYTVAYSSVQRGGFNSLLRWSNITYIWRKKSCSFWKIFFFILVDIFNFAERQATLEIILYM